MKNKSCLFISYDGLLDNLGQSQILPYLLGIAGHPRKVYVLSFEKPEKFYNYSQELRQELLEYGIFWKPLLFTKRLSHLGKLWDLIKMYVVTFWLIFRNKISIVHARGHVCAQVGLFYKRIFFFKLLFDCRGLWVDEKIDKGGWDLNRRFHKFLYKCFKKQEQKILRFSDQIVVLTKAVLPELYNLGVKDLDRVSVIPCCADFSHFKPFTISQKNIQRIKINIPGNAFLLGYVGSIGKMYMMDEFCKYFLEILNHEKNTYVLIVTPNVNLANQDIERYLPVKYHERIKCISASRQEMPGLIAIMDVMLSFIKPSYARLATSPTKIAESLACGVPVISNDGIGDVSEILRKFCVGYVVEDQNQIYDIVKKIKINDPIKIRDLAREIFDLKLAHQTYSEIYKKLQKEMIC